MTLETLKEIADKVTQKLNPSTILIDYVGLSARIVVVTDLFSELTLSQRFDVLYDLFYLEFGVPKTFPLSFEAWTVWEAKQIDEFEENT